MGAKEKGPKRFRQDAGLVYSCVARYSFVMLSLEKRHVVTLLKNLSTPKNSAVFLIGYNDKPREARWRPSCRGVSQSGVAQEASRATGFLQKAVAQRKRGEEQK